MNLNFLKNKKKYSKYLPSKKFVLITSFCIVLAVIIFVIFFMSSSGENFTIGSKPNLPLKVENQSITDLVEKDTNGDGIPDWEKILWGLDPNKLTTPDGIPYPVYIANKKKALNIEQSADADNQNLTETDKFAREFFASYSAMKSSGQVDSNTINNFSNSLGQNIVNQTLADQYTQTDVKISATDDAASKQKYYEDMENLFKSYKGIGMGDELDIVSGELASNSSGTTDNTEQNNKLATIASAYQDFAQKVMQISVPQSLVEYHLEIANAANDTGISVSNLEKISSDPVVGLSGLSQYQKYSDALVKAVSDLATALGK
jgi:hypothetical protein